MMPDELPPADPLPPRLRPFAPWTWGRSWKLWQRWALVLGLLFVGYLMSVIPVMWVTVRIGGNKAWDALLDSVYRPLVFGGQPRRAHDVLGIDLHGEFRRLIPSGGRDSRATWQRYPLLPAQCGQTANGPR